MKKIFLVFLISLIIFNVQAAGRGRGRTYPVNAYQVTDNSFFEGANESERWYGITFFSPSEFKGTDESVILIEADAHYLLKEKKNYLSGDFRMSFDPSLKLFADDAGMAAIPTLALSLPVDFEMIWRFVNNSSLEVGVTPGYYGDIEAFDPSVFGMPIRGVWYYAVNNSLSLRAGAEVRPFWNTTFMPIVGLAYSSGRSFYCEVGVPRTLLLLRGRRADYFAKAEWKNISYGMKDDPTEGYPELLEFDEWRASLGVAFRLKQNLKASIEIGTVLNRELNAQFAGGEGDVEMDNCLFGGFTLGTRF